MVVGGTASLWGLEEEEEVVEEMKSDLEACSLKSGTSGGEDKGDDSSESGGEKNPELQYEYHDTQYESDAW